jgi:hypothetical protein
MSRDKDDNLYQFTPSPPPPTGVSPPLKKAKAPRSAKGRRSRLTKTAAGLAVILGTGGGVAVTYSATSGAAASPAPAAATARAGSSYQRSTAAHPSGARWRSGPGEAHGAAGQGPMGSIHGTFTVELANGTFETIATQVGTAAAVTSGSITVQSADGFSQTYDLTSATKVLGSGQAVAVKAGDTVSLQALVSGTALTAQRVVDLTQLRAGHGPWAHGQGQPSGPDDEGGPPAA